LFEPEPRERFFFACAVFALQHESELSERVHKIPMQVVERGVIHNICEIVFSLRLLLPPLCLLSAAVMAVITRATGKNVRSKMMDI
jgi:hypothetical protein